MLLSGSRKWKFSSFCLHPELFLTWKTTAFFVPSLKQCYPLYNSSSVNIKNKKERSRSAVNTFQVRLTWFKSGRPHFCEDKSPGNSRWKDAWCVCVRICMCAVLHSEHTVGGGRVLLSVLSYGNLFLCINLCWSFLIWISTNKVSGQNIKAHMYCVHDDTWACFPFGSLRLSFTKELKQFSTW